MYHIAMVLGEWMEREIEEQIELLPARADSYLKLKIDPSEFDLVVIAARGSLDNVGLYLKYLVETEWNIPAVMAAPSVQTVYGKELRYPRTLGIGISQSGESPDVTAVIASLNGQGQRTLAITNEPESPLAKAANDTVLLDVGVEKCVAATKTYSASLLAAYTLVLRSKPDFPTKDWLDVCKDAAYEFAPGIDAAGIVFALGRGYTFGTACETALKLMECALVPCKSYSTADFEHGPKALLSPNTIAIVYGKMPEVLKEMSERVFNAQSTQEIQSPIWHAILLQCLALETARIRGFDPDSPPNLSKITKTL